MNRVKTKEEDDLPEYFARMIEYARKLVPAADAEDVALEALIDAYAERQPRPPASEKKRVKLWLFKLVGFRARAYRKAQKKRAAEVFYEQAEDMMAVPDPVRVAETIEDREWILLALAHLSERRQALVLSNGVEGEEGASLAREYRVSRFTMQSWLRRSYEALGEKMKELLDGPGRRLGMLLPFDFFGPEVARRSAWSRWARRLLVRVFGPPLRFAGKVGVVACVVGFTPSGPCSMEGEQRVVAAHSELRGDVVVTRSGVVDGNLREPAPNAVVRPMAMENVASKVSQRKQATSDEDANDADFSLLVKAKASLNRREPRKALVYLDEHACRFPKSENARERDILRAAAERAIRAQH